MQYMVQKSFYRVIIVVLVSFLGISLISAHTAVAATLPQQESSKASQPNRIIIPTAGVNVPIINVGVTPQGNLDVPHNFTQAGWYMYGTVPGAIGSAVIDGHVDN